MVYRVGAPVVATVMLFSVAAEAAKMPPIEAKGANATPACVTPGRLGAFLKSRNKSLDTRFERIAVDYMRHGEALGVRWDFAFFQMLVETGNLSFGGDVDAEQNNFAGLAATGGGEKGERFKSVADGVKAHLQHLQMYAGVRVDDPVAERTRKVQEWRVLDRWRQNLRRSVTFTDMAAKWAPGSRGYPRDIAGVAERFMSEFCTRPDPEPQLVAMARGASEQPVRQAAAAPADDTAERLTGEELARRAAERGRLEGDDRRRALGAGAAAIANLKILNGGTPLAETDQASNKPAAAPAATRNPPPRAPVAQKTALLPPTAGAVVGTGKGAGAAEAPASATNETNTAAARKGCKVWTASYGGQKSVIIQANVANQANYTVLDVNDGREAREVDAYIQAYAKGGRKIGDFANSTQALEKAFTLCPEN